jgi:hypothetical protein
MYCPTLRQELVVEGDNLQIEKCDFFILHIPIMSHSGFTLVDTATLYFRSLSESFLTLTPDQATIDAIGYYVQRWNKFPSVPEIVQHYFEEPLMKVWKDHVMSKGQGASMEDSRDVVLRAAREVFLLSGVLQHAQWLDNTLTIFLQTNTWPKTLIQIERGIEEISVVRDLDFDDLIFEEPEGTIEDFKPEGEFACSTSQGDTFCGCYICKEVDNCIKNVD